MAGGSHIVSIGGGEEPQREVEELVLTEEAPTPDRGWDDAVSPPSRHWRSALFAFSMLIVAAAWTGFFIWTSRAALQTGTIAASQVIALVRDWSLPVLLLCTVWLLAMRNSTREAARFGEAARQLGEESARLELRLTTVNRELSLAREFIAAQSRDIESLGRVAVERISEHAERLAGLIRENSARVDTIGTVSATSLDNMEKLRGQLPVIASSAKDVTNNIANAGRTAHAQLEDLVAGFIRLNEFGQASERQVDTVKSRVDAAMSDFAQLTQHLETFAAERFSALAERGEEFRLQLDRHEVEALAGIRNRAAALGAELEQTRKLLDGHEEESLTSLRARLSAVRDESSAIARALREGEASAIETWRKAAERLTGDLDAALAQVEAIDARAEAMQQARLAAMTTHAEQAHGHLAERDRRQEAEIALRQGEAERRHAAAIEQMDSQLERADSAIAARRAAHDEQARRFADSVEATTARLDQVTSRIEEIANLGQSAEAGLAANLRNLATQFEASREGLAGTDAAVAALTDASVRLLELIQAGAQHAARDLPEAIEASEVRLFDFERRAGALATRMAEAQEGGALLAAQIDATHAGLAAALTDLDALHHRLSEHEDRHRTTLDELRTALAAAGDHGAALADHADTRLRGAIEDLRAAARGAASDLESMSADAIAALAARLGEQSRAAIEDVLRSHGDSTVHQLETAAQRAAAASHEATSQLRDQLVKVNELASNLEQRIAYAREKAQEQVDDGFARRAALITESLNSNAIDITRALDAEVTDTAWSSYLRGDRGIFTRRAVKLLEVGEAREIVQIYENDRNFRDHVSQYIHDFEAMLRQLLATRDGHALSVTLLSSEMGKLYVALAQAIERLRN